MECPKCGRAVEPGAFICPGCEFILDTSFLGEDITDDEHDHRGHAAVPLKKSVDFGEDAIILGNGQGEYSDFSSKDAGMTREVTHARFYIGGNTAVILHVDSVPEIAPGILENSLKMSPFERHVLGFINGKRSIGRIQKKSAMEDSEFMTSVAMLADKGIIRLRTTKKRKKTEGGPSSLSTTNEVSRVASSFASNSTSLLSSDRTVVASVEQLSAEHMAAQQGRSQLALATDALAAAEDGVSTHAQLRGSRTNPAEPTIIKSAELKKNSVGTAGFQSVRIQEQQARDPLPPVVIDEPAGNDWGEGDNNVSSVFARATPSSPTHARVPSVADAPSQRLPDVTGEFTPQPQTHAPKATSAAPVANPTTHVTSDREISAAVLAAPGQDDLIPPGGDDDFFARARSKENPILKAAAHADAQADAQAQLEENQTTGPRVRARTTAPPMGDTREPPYSVEESQAEDDIPAALRDPTGLGDLSPVQTGGGEPIDPADVDAAEAADDDAGDDAVDAVDAVDADDVVEVNDVVEADAPKEQAEEAVEEAAQKAIGAPPSEEPYDDLPATAPRLAPRAGTLPPASELDDEPTADISAYSNIATSPLPPEARHADEVDQDEIDAADDDESFDVDMHTASLDLDLISINTAPLPAKEPPNSVQELPHDAMSPLPSRPFAAPAPAQAPQQAPPALPAAPSYLPPSAPRPPALPGQVMAAGAAPVRAPTQTINKSGQPVPARTSAGSTVPFEQGRKAEKIFEQALKDHAEGRISSARMNAKLAAMYDPSIATYRVFLADLDAMGAQAKAPGAGKPKELTLFEQASDAEGRGDFVLAVHLLEEAVSINPKAAALRNRLGVVMSIRLKRHDEALEQLRIAIELEPGNIVYMNNFSKVTALLDSQLGKGPEDKKGKKGKKPDKIEIKKMRPKIF